MLRIKLVSFLLHVSELYIFYPRLRKFYKNSIQKNDPVILDVGSNKGQTIEFFTGIFPNCTIFGFEPNPDLFRLLTQKYQDRKNIRLFNLGVSEISGELLFHQNKLDETSSFEELNYESEYLKTKSRILGVTPENIIEKSYNVPVVTLSDFLAKEKINLVDIIKIDTEGHEFKCLKGLFSGTAKKVYPKYIQLEQHFDDSYAHAEGFPVIEALLKANKFSAHQRIKHSFGDFEEIVFINNN